MTRVKILDEAVYIFQSSNTPGKGMNPIIIPLGISKIIEQTGLFNFGMTTGEGEWKLC